MPKCELCQFEEETHLYYLDDFMRIADCKVCRVPMGIIRRHTMTITKGEYDRLTYHLIQAGAAKFGKGNFWIDRKQRRVRTHLHWHARRK